MTHSLTIKDNSGVELYDLLGSPDLFGSVLGIDLGTRQISPLNNGRWQETYQLFARSDNLATSISFFVFEIDEVCKQINDYGESPAYNSPIWLHEKSEGELVARRRAPLFSASQQPIANGAVGPLLINNGYIGLLTIERGDWESIALVEDSISITVTEKFGTQALVAAGTLNGRFEELGIESSDIATDILAFGARDTNFGVTNFQPCVNFGVATGISGVTRVTDANATSPTGQPAPTGNALTYSLWIGTLADTLKVTMDQVSLSTLDSVNRDYVGDYQMFFRYGIRAITGTATYYVKFTPFYGYEGDFTYNDPIYIPAWQAPVVTGDYYHGVNAGEITIPVGVFKDFGGAADTLKNFTFGIELALAGTQDATIEILIDSIILVPNPSVILTDVNDAASPTGTDVDTRIVTNPDNSVNVTARLERFTGESSGSMDSPSGGGVLVYYNEKHDIPAGTPARTLYMVIKNRYNSLSG